MKKDAAGNIVLGPAGAGKSFMGKLREIAKEDHVRIDLSDPHALAKVFFDVTHGVDPKVVEQLHWLLEEITPKTAPKP